ncbi:hypothetical protein RvY_07497 [Ramazzottius varieornatus]|uniref:Small ribosomal subunit protein mS33 n=1 Tax=Ramazzottius varieornatus TaxID=947166 RepID=A0A1D1V2D7_RAMVA|nr:hypothetical protein RvY_07497 [Ramazzottius varieornatus]
MAATSSRYTQMMERLSRRIFNEPLKPLNSKGHRIVKAFSEKPIDARPEITNYYPPLPQLWKMVRVLRQHGLFRDEHLDFNEEMERLRVLRGKVRPKREPKK